MDDNARFTDPKLVSTATPDLHIQTTSPAIDGSDPNTLPVGQDIDGQARQSGARVDVGADEVVTTAPPTVALTSPAPGSHFGEGATVTLEATAADSDGTIAQVEFFRNTTSIGVDTSAPYQAVWSNAQAGSFTLTARARDNQGAETTSAPVNATVVGRPVVSASAGDQRVTLTWTAVTGATSYNVRRSDDGGASYTLIQPAVPGTSYTDNFVTNGVTYFYQVSASFPGGEAPDSTPVSATPQPVPPPPAPTGLTATGADARVNLSWNAVGSATSYTVKRSLVSGTGHTVLAADLTTTSYSDTAVVNGTTYYYVVSASNGSGEGPDSAQASATPSAAPAWSTQDVGAVGAAGSWSESAGTHTIRGSGADIWNTADEFRFVYRTITGNATIIARVASVQDADPVAHFTKAGIMFREKLIAGSKNVFALVTPLAANGYRFQNRATEGGTTARVFVTPSALPGWLKVVRAGNTFTASYSTSGSSWQPIGSATVTMAATIQVGLAVTSHNDGTLATSTMDSVTISTP